MTILLARIVPRDQLVVVHAPLGEVEWPGTIEHIELCCAQHNWIYVAVLIMLRSAGTSPFCRNVRTADRHITFFIHNDFRKATIPLSSFHGLPGLGWAASQNATALAFISRLIST